MTSEPEAEADAVVVGEAILANVVAVAEEEEEVDGIVIAGQLDGAIRLVRVPLDRGRRRGVDRLLLVRGGVGLQ